MRSTPCSCFHPWNVLAPSWSLLMLTALPLPGIIALQVVVGRKVRLLYDDGNWYTGEIDRRQGISSILHHPIRNCPWRVHQPRDSLHKSLHAGPVLPCKHGFSHVPLTCLRWKCRRRHMARHVWRWRRCELRSIPGKFARIPGKHVYLKQEKDP